ncbi:hypothetical protein DFO70_106212 [Cytobacillus firmus]|uniref:Uncharacterized protein n=2 Tax=Cytobacillus TaxID=2675230 RepID=A0A366JWU4_CYTFI|nr:hypothetical protein DFO70_106212 [Cytobacillus firmus]TDX42683.1 hypothetical protein DFO72_106212 [Cytobacillus oceanisediminis]
MKKFPFLKGGFFVAARHQEKRLSENKKVYPKKNELSASKIQLAESKSSA